MITKQNIFPQSWKGKEHKVVLAISLVIYVVALFNTAYYPVPVGEIPPDSDWASVVKEGYPCWWFFLFDVILGWLPLFMLLGGYIHFELVPITNLFYFYCCWLLLRNKRKKRTLILMGACSLVVFLFSFYHDSMLQFGPSSDYLFDIGRKGIGYYLWLLSYLCLFVGRWIVPEPPMNIVKDNAEQ